MVFDLVGVTHGSVASFMGVISTQIVVAPSSRLLEIITSLEKGSKVGLERLDKELPKTEGSQIIWNMQNEYWDPLVELCQDCELEVINLDDWESYNERHKIMLEKEKLLNTFDGLGEKDADIPLEVRLDLARRDHKFNIEVQYIREIVRDEKMLETIAKHPDMKLAIVGRGHENHWVSNFGLLSERGIEIGMNMSDAYNGEINHYEFFAASEHESSIHRQAELTIGLPPDLKMIALREKTIRLYSAATKNRVFPDKKPDFVGTWDVNIPARGLFEIYITEREEFCGSTIIKGTIEDVNGSAEFAGNIKDNEMMFNKTYSEDAIRAGGVSGNINFSGRLEGKEYRGFFVCTNYHGYKDKFSMEPFQE